MRLTSQQQDALRRERGIFANEACDRCGKLLGSVRYTRKGEPGEWCSELCRDGVERKADRKRGRPRLALSATSRLSHRRKQVRDAVKRHRLNVIKNCPHSNETQGLADSIFASLDNPTQNEAQSL